MEDQNIKSTLAGEFEAGSPMEFDILNNDPLEELEDPTPVEGMEEPDASKEPDASVADEDLPAPVSEEEEDKLEEIEEEYTQAAILAESYKQEGILPDNIEITSDFTGQQLQQALFESTAKRLEDQKDAYYAAQGYSQEALEIATLMNQGIHPNTIWEAMQDRQLSSLEVEGDDEDTVKANRAYLIEEMYKDKDVPAKRIKMLIEDLQDTGEDLEEAKMAQQYFAEKEKARLEQERLTIAQQQQAQEEAERRRLESLKQLVDEGDFYGVHLKSEKDKTAFMDFLNKQDQVVRVPGPDGKEQIYRMSGYEKKMWELQQDPRKQLAFARLLQMDFNLGDIEQEVSNEVQEDILNKLNAKTTKKVIRRGARPNSGGSIQSRPVAVFDN